MTGPTYAGHPFGPIAFTVVALVGYFNGIFAYEEVVLVSLLLILTAAIQCIVTLREIESTLEDGDDE